MDPPNLRLQFVDLDDANEQERIEIEGIIFARSWNFKLPWGTRVEAGGGEEEEELELVQEELEIMPDSGELVDDTEHANQDQEQPHGEWIQHYDEQEMGQEGTMEALPTMQLRGPMYPPQGYMLMGPAVGLPPWSVMAPPPHQHYAQNYYPEADVGQPRLMAPRPSKNREKHQQPHPQFLPYLPMMQYIPYSPMDAYNHGYQIHTEQQAYHPDAQFHHSPHVEMEHLPKETPLPVPEVEHLCYVTDVTVKAPTKKKPQLEDAPLEQPDIAPATPPLIVHQTGHPSVSIVPAAPHPVAITSTAPERAPEAPLEAPLDEPVPLPVEGPAVAPLPDVVPAPAPAPIPAPSQPQSDYPDLDGAASAAAVPSPAQDHKTWANLLFAPPVKPTARVPPAPRNEVASVGDQQNAAGPTKNSPAVAFKNNIDYRISEDPYTVRLVTKLRDYELDHRAMNLAPRGMTNPSNYCYVNAILQALIAIPPFFNLLKALPIPQDPRQASCTPILGAMIELAQQFHQLPAKAKRRDKPVRDEVQELPTGTSFEPRCIYNVLDKIRGDNSFSFEGRQEDAEEFLSCLLNGLNDEMFEVLKLMGATGSELTNGDAANELEDSSDWKLIGPRNRGTATQRAVCGNTPISKIFRGQQQSRVLREGGENTHSVQPFFSLQLDIEKSSSVKQALELLMNKDAVEGMTCSRTNRAIDAWTQTTLEELPIILILHLKCFDYNHDGCSKIIKTVDYPVELKIESKLVSGTTKKYNAKQKVYKLIAVVYHDGKEATKGHYETDVYHVGLGLWIRYDDGNVRCVREEHVLKPILPRVPYLLVYRRSDTASSKR